MSRTLNQSFILNTLSTISYLCDSNSTLCKECVKNLAKVLQCQICEESDGVHELDKELLVVSSFIELENIRFNGNIRYIEEIGDGRDCLLPVGLLLEIVQNSVEYTLSKIPGGGTVAISCDKKNENFVLSVKNSGGGYGGFVGKYKQLEKQKSWLNDINHEVELLCAGRVLEEINENECIITIILPDL